MMRPVTAIGGARPGGWQTPLQSDHDRAMPTDASPKPVAEMAAWAMRRSSKLPTTTSRAWARLLDERYSPEVGATIGDAVNERQDEWRSMVKRAIDRGELPPETGRAARPSEPRLFATRRELCFMADGETPDGGADREQVSFFDDDLRRRDRRASFGRPVNPGDRIGATAGDDGTRGA